MLFNSFDFLLFFPIVCAIFFLLPKTRWRNWFLLVASYYFYMNWEPAYALLLLTSTVVTYIAAIAIQKSDGQQKRKKTFLIGSLAINLLILLFFKYYAFIGENITGLFNALGIGFSVPNFGILLPVGISFYTFQALGYSIDVYRGKIEAERNFFSYALFVSFFPQLVAGPIERSTNLLPQFYKKHRFDTDRAISGLKLMLWGYFLKLVVADRCAIYVDLVYNHLDNHPGMSALVASVLFCFQLYGDFAGYSYIAIGASKVMGFKLMDNFRHPYLFSSSIQDYWKRNHISLTSWFMDYVYYPLTEKRNTLNWWCVSIFITFLISGFWHGAAWSFVIWGAIHGLLLIGEMRTNKRRMKWEKKHGLTNNPIYVWSQRLIVFAVLALTLVFFRANSLNDAFIALQQIFTPSDIAFSKGKAALLYSSIGILTIFAKEYIEEYSLSIYPKSMRSDMVSVMQMSFMLLCILWLGVFDGGQFIYFQF